jgi:hypothetical protein
MRNSWTDERLDDGFDQGEVGQLRAEMRAEFESVRSETSSLRKEMHDGFASLNRTLLQVGGGIIAALIGVIATQL